MSDYINKNVYNGNELLSLYPNSGIKVNNLYDESYKLIIVTADSLKTSFQKLANWKTIKGIRTKILTVEDIDTTYVGQNLSMKIKEALYDYYDGNYQGLKYAILGGDVNIVPSQMVPVISGVSPSDLFFGCFDNMTWNNNGNSVVGEIIDNIDLDPEIFVSRIPVSCIMDVRNYVQRIIDYELSPNLENWENNIFMCGAHIHNLYQDSIGNTISDAQKESDELYDSIIAPNWNCSRTRLFDTDTDFEGGSHYTFNKEHVQLELSKGYTIINVATHGDPDCYQMEWFETENYMVDDALSLVNSGSSVIVTLSCLTNAFDSLETCLSEAFIRNPYSGILAYFGASRENYISVCFKYNQMFYKNLFLNTSHIFGEVAQAARSAYIANCNNPNSYRSVCLCLNPIGDPTFSIFLNKPKLFSNIEFTNEDSNLQLITNVDSCNICITSMEDNGVSFYQFYDNISNLDLSQIQCASRICITKTGYVPYLLYYGIDYIQNEIIQNEKRDYYTNNLKIGKNITNLKPIGNVLIKNSSIMIKTNTLELHEGTTIIDSEITVK